MMRRWARVLVSLFSGTMFALFSLAAVATLALWVVSYRTPVAWVHRPPTSSPTFVRSFFLESGRIHLAIGERVTSANSGGWQRGFGGFQVARFDTGGGTLFHSVRCPVWLPLLTILIYPTVFVIRRPLRRRYRRKHGLCLDCGYDLTGNVSGKCSECGKALEAADPDQSGEGLSEVALPSESALRRDSQSSVDKLPSPTNEGMGHPVKGHPVPLNDDTSGTCAKKKACPRDDEDKPV